jgi:hypothetical protein
MPACSNCTLKPIVAYGFNDLARLSGGGQCVVLDYGDEHWCACRFGRLSVNYTLTTNVDTFELLDTTDGTLARFDVVSRSSGGKIGDISEYPGLWKAEPIPLLAPDGRVLLGHALSRVQAAAGRYSRAWAA